MKSSKYLSTAEKTRSLPLSERLMVKQQAAGSTGMRSSIRDNFDDVKSFYVQPSEFNSQPSESPCANRHRTKSIEKNATKAIEV